MASPHSHGWSDHQRSEHGELIVGNDPDHVGAGIPVDENCVALDRGRGITMEMKLVDLDHVVGFFQRPLDVPPVE